MAYTVDRGGASRSVLREPRSLSSSVEDAATVFVVETGTTDPITALQLDAGPQRFLTRALVEASEDRAAWRTLGRNLPVYDRGGQLRALQLAIPAGVCPYLRVTLDRLGRTHVTLRGIMLVTQRIRSDDTEPVTVRLGARDEMTGETRLVLVLPGAHLQLSALDFNTPEPVFDRSVRIVQRVFENESIRELVVGQGVLARAAVAAPSSNKTVRLPADFVTRQRELILSVDNGDSPPLALNEISARRRLVSVVFYATTVGNHTFYVGNPRAKAPRYDVSTLAADLADRSPARPVPGLLGANPAYRPGEPLPEISALGTTLDVASWGFRKSVRPNAAGVQELELDPAVLARARRDLGDLRLMSDDRQIPFVVEHSSLTRTIAVSATAVSDPKHPAMSRWRLVLPYPHLPLIRLTVAVSTPLFQREVRLWEEITDDRGYTNRRWLGQASWSQTPGRRVNVFSIGLNQHPETETLWLETDNGDNPPIRLGEVLAHHGVTRLLFQVGIDVPIALYYGQARVAAPRYDLGLVGAQLLEADKSAPGLDPEVALKEPSFIQSVVLGGRAAILFWGMLAVVVVVLLAVIARLLPKAPPAAGGGTSD
ncbi:MAG: hypothetical protein A3G75_00720 [Verrucomicrobia bacterium RIFCSPLOWO2_12_FULL_64_8]|nr:MAG: hypothetical protein A3G75_00720 [Verrucomicrobia bacterium RIFCSPLOWO2_12_FULL_64_8]